MIPVSVILEVLNLKVVRGGAVLLDIPDLKIEEGEILALIGPNGAGKTTLLQTLARLAKFSGGDLYFRGEMVSSDAKEFAYRRKLAMVFQEPLLFDTTVYENVATGLKIRRIPRQEIQRIVAENLERFGISHLAQRSARKISGGEGQRTALARALAVQPEILFLDEPFAALDPPTREALVEDLEKVLRQTRTTTVMATHDRLEALRLSDRIAVMNQGKILQLGSPDEVMNRPVNEFVASFVGVETILGGKVIRRDRGSFIVSVEGREIEAVGEVAVGESVALCIRPENVTLAIRPSQEATSARNAFPGAIQKVIPLGLYHKIHLQCGFPLVAFITGHSLENLELEAGKEVVATFKATSIHVVRKRGKIRSTDERGL